MFCLALTSMIPEYNLCHGVYSMYALVGLNMHETDKIDFRKQVTFFIKETFDDIEPWKQVLVKERK